MHGALPKFTGEGLKVPSSAPSSPSWLQQQRQQPPRWTLLFSRSLKTISYHLHSRPKFFSPPQPLASTSLSSQKYPQDDEEDSESESESESLPLMLKLLPPSPIVAGNGDEESHFEKSMRRRDADEAAMRGLWEAVRVVVFVTVVGLVVAGWVVWMAIR